jgi:hypothetical protein
MGVHLTCFLVSEVKISTRTQAHLKNMMFYLHQNILILIEFILQRLPTNSTSNVWAHQLEKLVISKRAKKSKRNENLISLRQNNEIILSIIKNICQSGIKAVAGTLRVQNPKFKAPKPLFNAISTLLRQADKLAPSRTREIMNKALLAGREILAQCTTQESVDGDKKGLMTTPYLRPLQNKDVV